MCQYTCKTIRFWAIDMYMLLDQNSSILGHILSQYASFHECAVCGFQTCMSNRMMYIGAACVLDAENQLPAPRSYQNCPTELDFVDWISNFEIKFSGTVLVASGCWKLVFSIKNTCSTNVNYSMSILLLLNMLKNPNLDLSDVSFAMNIQISKLQNDPWLKMVCLMVCSRS